MLIIVNCVDLRTRRVTRTQNAPGRGVVIE